MVRIFKHFISRWSILLLVVESALGVGSVYIGVTVRFLGMVPDEIHGELLLGRAVFFAFVMVVSMAATGRYQRLMEDGFTGEILRVAVSFIIGLVAMGLLFYVFPNLFLGRGAIGIALFFSFAGFLLTRRVFFRYVLDLDLLKRRVLIFGTGENANLVAGLAKSIPHGLSIVGFWPVPGQAQRVSPVMIVAADDLPDWAQKHEVNEIIIALDGPFPTLFMKDVLDCKSHGIAIVDLPGFFEKEKHLINMDILGPEWWIHNSDGLDLSSGRQIGKRIFDISLSMVFFLVSWPIMLLAALAIWVESGGRGPIFYTQERVGFGGRVFQVMKFRSMRIDAEKDGVARWARKNDERITKVGAFLRVARIDELPQFFNVLKGEMSLVGPRPERPAFVEILKNKIPYYTERLRVKPGITGWAQVRYGYGASEEDAAEKLKYDLYYIKNHGLFLDLLVLIHSVEVVLFGTGVTSPRETPREHMIPD